MFYSNVHQYILNRLLNIPALRKIWVLLFLEKPVIDFLAYNTKK